ncbi:MAG: hypothetical protein AABW48_01555 [Nanoarchaeota archaeon]
MKKQNLNVGDLVSGILSGELKVVTVDCNYPIQDEARHLIRVANLKSLIKTYQQFSSAAMSDARINPWSGKLTIYRCVGYQFSSNGEMLKFSGELLDRCRHSPFEFERCGSALEKEVVALRDLGNYLIIKN